MDQPIPDRRKVPKDVFCLLEIVREVNAEGFEGNLVVAQRPFPNIGSPAGCDCDLPTFLECLERSEGIGYLPQRGHELGGTGEVGRCRLPKAISPAPLGLAWRVITNITDLINNF